MTTKFLHLRVPSIINSEGVGGRIKQTPEDFIVGEIIEDQQILDPREDQFNLPGRTGLFLHFVLIKRNLDTSNALDWVSKLWRIQRDTINVAGLKDKRAITAQRVSVWGVKSSFEKGTIKEIDLPTIKTKSHSLRLKEIRLGELWGNYFDITIRDIQLPEEEAKERIDTILKEIKDIGGIQNSFGIQRFGEIRPITHLVGKKLLEDNLKEAIKIYVGKVFDGEAENVIKARNSFWENEDAEQSLNLFPSYLRIERKLLLSLKKRKQNYMQALSSLPLQLQKLFIHAFQSFLFNRYLKTRYDLYGKKITEPISGEVVKNNAVFVPLIGANTKLEGEMGEIYLAILEEEELSLLEFQKPFIKKIGGKGAFRSISFDPEDIRITESGVDELNEGRTKVKMNFKIKKGSYATEFLREIMS
ncbi:MAG: tRNA pseudouridine(13) synthase TruD [Candidatus Heimdallarchaeota archaeon]|nr:tRNA pseudouridine(13) synthase TruD [Candidatus Heimdallarchaeota archaeon]MCK4876446.1 tRNA pseudouridine(13) synthase TruD [Candidatus Heimdallarchaeota archaeon]